MTKRTSFDLVSTTKKESLLRLELARSFEKCVDFSFQSFVVNEPVRIFTIPIVMDWNDLNFVVVVDIFNVWFRIEPGRLRACRRFASFK